MATLWGPPEGELSDYLSQFRSGSGSDNTATVRELPELTNGEQPEGRKVLPPGPLSQEYLNAFISRLCLDHHATALLVALPEDLRKDVVQDFNPPPEISNYSAYLHTFVQARLKERGLDGIAPIPDRPHDDGYAAPMPEGLADFLSSWELDSKAEKLLRGLDENCLKLVMQGFKLEGGTRNRGEQLENWVRHVQESLAENSSKRARQS